MLLLVLLCVIATAMGMYIHTRGNKKPDDKKSNISNHEPIYLLA